MEIYWIAIAASTGNRRGDLADRLLGDGLVPVSSALGFHCNPALHLQISKARQWVAYPMNHFELTKQPAVHEKIQYWLEMQP